MGELTTHHSRNSNNQNSMWVTLYPNSESVKNDEAAEDGVVTQGLKDGLDQLVDANAVPGYVIQCWCFSHSQN